MVVRLICNADQGGTPPPPSSEQMRAAPAEPLSTRRVVLLRPLQRKTGKLGQRGSASRSRYECIQEPAGTWKVWDNALDQAAELDGRKLVNLSLFRAEAACAMLNRIHLGTRF